jgi:hypothetical protein
MREDVHNMGKVLDNSLERYINKLFPEDQEDLGSSGRGIPATGGYKGDQDDGGGCKGERLKRKG